MKLPGWIATSMLVLALTGCFHRTRSVQSPPLAPPANDQSMPTATADQKPAPAPAPATNEPAKPAETTPQQTAQQPSEAPKPPVHHKKPAPAPQHQMASIPSNGVSAIGQLSSGNPGDYRRQTEEQIAADERSLRAINRQLNDQEQRTVAHIRDFLRQARQALASGDVDGAHTLAAKAKVLLAELNR